MGIALTATAGLAFAGIGLAQAALVPDVIDLGDASTYAVLAGEGATNAADNGIEGDVGVSPGASSTATGFDSDQIRSTEDATDAQEALTSAYNEAAAASPEVLDNVELGGQTLPAGAYSGGALGLTGTLTLNAANDPDAIWVFQAASTLTTGGASSIEFVDGIGSACNVFWQIGSSAFLVGGDFVGTIMAQTSISSSNATVEGRLLARSGAVTLTGTSITVPDGCEEETGPGGSPSPSPSPSSSPSSSPSPSPSSGPSDDDQEEADEAADEAQDSADRAADAADEAAEGADDLDSDEADDAADRAADAAEDAADAAEDAAEAADRGDKADARDAAERADEAADRAEAAAQDVQDLVDAAGNNGGGGTGTGGGSGGNGGGSGSGSGSGNGSGSGSGSGNGSGSGSGSGNGSGNGNGGGTGNGSGTGTGTGVDQKPVVVAGVPVTSPVKAAPVLPNTGSNPGLAGGIAGLLLLLGFGATAIATKRRNRLRARH